MINKKGSNIKFKYDAEVDAMQQNIKESNTRTCQTLKQVQEDIKKEDIDLTDKQS